MTFAMLTLALLVGILLVLARIGRVLQQLQVSMNTLRQQAEPVLQDARQLTQDTRASLSTMLSQTQMSVAAITKTTEEIALMAHDQVVELRALAQDTVLAARNQVERLDDLVSRTTTRVDQTAAIVQSEVLQPVRELHCIVVGVQRALQVLMARKRHSIDQVYQDEELFI
jgi:ribonuclease HII